MQLKRRPDGEFFFPRSLKCLLGVLFPSLWSFSSFSDGHAATGRHLHRKLLLNQSFKNQKTIAYESFVQALGPRGTFP